MATFDWEKCGSLPQTSRHLYPQCVVLQGRLFLTVSRSDFDTRKARLYAFSSDMTQWVEFSMPTTNFALTTYRSKLVLVGGWHLSTRKFTKELWTSDDGKNWTSSLPPLSTFRSSPLAVNTGSPEYLGIWLLQVVSCMAQQHWILWRC